MPGATPNLALPYPYPQEAPDGPGAIYALATALDGQSRSHNWTPYTPTTGISVGAGGSLVFSYRWEHGDVHVKGTVNFGSSPTITSAFFSLPLQAGDAEWPRAVNVRLVDAGVNSYPGSIEFSSTTQFFIDEIRSDGTYARLDNNVNSVFGFGNGDWINLDFVYTPAV